LQYLACGPGTTQAQISYKWAPLSFNIEERFAKEIKTGTIPSSILSSQNCPAEERSAKLVQAEENKDGCMVMIIGLTAFESLLLLALRSVKPATKKILFESDEACGSEKNNFLVFFVFFVLFPINCSTRFLPQLPVEFVLVEVL
jgi:hypothetical protein